jgi:hypothetical protein
MSGQLSSTAGNSTPSHSAATPTAQHFQVQGGPARANSADSPRSTAKPPVAQQTPGSRAKANQVPFSYRLRHYRWRTFLSIAGPLIVLGFLFHLLQLSQSSCAEQLSIPLGCRRPMDLLYLVLDWHLHS